MKTEALYDVFRGATGVATDTRKCAPGTLFFALKGDNFDGNRFADDALKRGCVAAVVDDPALFDLDGMFGVDDVLTALQMLAGHHRAKWDFPVIGLTGSNGKTTTKELMLAVLGMRYKVYGTRGNLNNHIGVPLTLLEIPADAEMAIIEMGANHVGEIQNLARIAQPTHGLITNIGRAHLEGFGSEEGVLKGKTELFEHLRSVDGVALMRSDDPKLMQASAGMRRVPIEDQPVPRLALPGAHNVQNAQAAWAVGRLFDVPEVDVRKALQTFEPHSARGERQQTERNELLLDCYNANPSSVEAALRAFALNKTGDHTGHSPEKLCILGDMKELGAYAEESHGSIVDLLDELRLDHLLVGPCFTIAVEKARSAQTGGASVDRGFAFADITGLQQHIMDHPIEGKQILLKGSRSMALEQLIELL